MSETDITQATLTRRYPGQGRGATRAGRNKGSGQGRNQGSRDRWGTGALAINMNPDDAEKIRKEMMEADKNKMRPKFEEKLRVMYSDKRKDNSKVLDLDLAKYMQLLKEVKEAQDKPKKDLTSLDFAPCRFLWFRPAQWLVSTLTTALWLMSDSHVTNRTLAG